MASAKYLVLLSRQKDPQVLFENAAMFCARMHEEMRLVAELAAALTTARAALGDEMPANPKQAATWLVARTLAEQVFARLEKRS